MSYSLNTLFIKTIASWLIFESVKALKSGLKHYLHFLIPEAMAQIFNPVAEIIIPIGIPSIEAKPEIKIQIVHAVAKIRNLSI